ncbi:MAG: DUF4197 domain-containing protein [Bacteroidales bacterium]|jgi:hypothetical protein|nr:DUF4197 domain-containing protein [Bacteroidales bacterium]
MKRSSENICCYILAIVFAFTCAGFSSDAQAQLLKKAKKATAAAPAASSLSETDITSGLKEALVQGVKESSAIASAVDGFYKNAKITIPFPPEANKMKSTLVNLGMGKQVEAFEQSMNRAAEEAAKSAFETFAAAIKEMTVKDGISIVNGGDDAATKYLREKTYSTLEKKFTPVVKTAIDKVKLTSYWNPLVTQYNKLPRVKKQNPNLENYITGKTIDGLMTLIAEQEAKIRKDPAAQVSDLLRRVFGK